MCVEPTTAVMLASAGSSLIQFQQAKAQQKAQYVAQKRQNELARANAIRRYATCLLYTSPSPRDVEESRMPSSA